MNDKIDGTEIESILSKEDALILCEAFEIDFYMRDQEEIDLMIENNPRLHIAQRNLFYMANPNELDSVEIKIDESKDSETKQPPI